MRPLSFFAASTCENATHPRCRCRCGGSLHGAKRGDVTKLPPDDPHHAEPEKVNPQTSILEALDNADVLARLERARAPGARAPELVDVEPTEEETNAWLEELREFATRGVSAQHAVDGILEKATAHRRAAHEAHS